MASRKHYYFEDKDKYFSTFIVGVLVSLPLWWFCVIARFGQLSSEHDSAMKTYKSEVQAYEKEIAAVPARWWFLSRPTQPVHKGAEVIMGVVVIQLLLIFPLTYWLISEPALVGFEKFKEYLDDQKVKSQQRAFQRSDEKMQRESQHQAHLQQVSNGAHEIIQLLGSINQYVIVYQNLSLIHI